MRSPLKQVDIRPCHVISTRFLGCVVMRSPMQPLLLVRGDCPSLSRPCSRTRPDGRTTAPAPSCGNLATAWRGGLASGTKSTINKHFTGAVDTIVCTLIRTQALKPIIYTAHRHRWTPATRQKSRAAAAASCCCAPPARRRRRPSHRTHPSVPSTHALGRCSHPRVPAVTLAAMVAGWWRQTAPPGGA